jgi:hypothetical protein
MSLPFQSGYGAGIGGSVASYGTRAPIEETIMFGRPFLTIEQLSFGWGSASYEFSFHVMSEPGPGSVSAFAAGAPNESPSSPFAEFAPFMGTVGPPIQASGFAGRGAPSNGHAVVQLMNSTSQPAFEAGALAASIALPWTVPAVVTAPRMEGLDGSLSIGDAAQGPMAARAVALSSSAVGEISTSTDVDAASANWLWVLDQSDPASAVTAETATSSSGGFTFRMTAGPFVSRNAGPLGPILASAGGDPTPEVDRNERALHQRMGRRELDTGGGDDIDLSEIEARTDLTGGADGPVLAIRGPGGFSLKVTSLSRRRRSNLSELVSAIQSPVEEAATSAIDSAEVVQASTSADAPTYVNAVKAVCLLALSLGMSSGMLFPDLLASLRRRLPATRVQRKSNRRPL